MPYDYQYNQIVRILPLKRIVAGATGLIGTELVNHWLRDGHTVIVIGRNKEKIRKQFQGKVEALEWNALKPDYFKNAEIVVNLAGEGIADKRWSESRRKEILQSRIITTNTIVSLLISLGSDAPPLFNASAIGIYGLQPQVKNGLPLTLDETTLIDSHHAPDFLSHIGREWEKATFPAKENGIRVVNMRFGVVLAKQGGALPKIVQPFYFFLGGPIGTGNQPFSWIAIDDLLRAIDFLIDKNNISGAVNIVSPQCVTQRDLAKTIGHVLHKPSFIRTPSFMLKLMFGDMAHELLLEGQHVHPQRLLELKFKFKYPDIESALRHVYSL